MIYRLRDMICASHIEVIIFTRKRENNFLNYQLSIIYFFTKIHSSNSSDTVTNSYPCSISDGIIIRSASGVGLRREL